MKNQYPLSGETVRRFFPKRVRYTHPDHTVTIFDVGVQSVPVEIVDSPWLIANGVIEYAPGAPLPPLTQKAPVGSQAHVSTATGAGILDAARAAAAAEAEKTNDEATTAASPSDDVASESDEPAVTEDEPGEVVKPPRRRR